MGTASTVLAKVKRSSGWVVSLVLIGFLFPTSSFANARSDYLVRLMGSSDSFRVRTQAALSLSRLGEEPGVVDALRQRLRDRHPAVRTAAVSSLEAIGDPRVLPDVRRLSRDRATPVRRAVRTAIRVLERAERSAPRAEPVPERSNVPARYYVGLAEVAGVDGVSRGQRAAAAEFLRGRLNTLDGVVVAPSSESNQEARRAITRRRLTGYYLDTNVVEMRETDGGVRAVVSVIVSTYPGRDMRVILQGAATVRGGTGAQAEDRAIQGAFSGALRRLPQAFAAGDER